MQIDADAAVMNKRCSYWSRTRRIATSDLQSARAYVPQVQSERSQPTWGVEIVYRNGSFVLPADTPAEQRWLIAEVNDFLTGLRR